MGLKATWDRLGTLGVEEQHEMHERRYGFASASTPGVVAGVIGVRKFIYDLWGDTVNTASRMESTGVIGAIQVTEATYQRLEHDYEFEARGGIEVKGKGTLQTFLLVGRKQHAAVA
jgi:class 3 adenylate cyclase